MAKLWEWEPSPSPPGDQTGLDAAEVEERCPATSLGAASSAVVVSEATEAAKDGRRRGETPETRDDRALNELELCDGAALSELEVWACEVFRKLEL